MSAIIVIQVLLLWFLYYKLFDDSQWGRICGLHGALPIFIDYSHFVLGEDAFIADLAINLQYIHNLRLRLEPARNPKK